VRQPGIAAEENMKIYWVRFFIFVLVLTVFSAGNLFNALGIGSLDIKPNLLLIATVFFAIRCATPDAVAASFAIGFAADLSGAAMGPGMITFGLIGSLMSQLQRVVLMQRIVHQIMSIFIITLAAGTLMQLLLYLKTGDTAMEVAKQILGGARYTGEEEPLVREENKVYEEREGQ